MNFTTATHSILSLTALSIAGTSLSACGGSEFTCEDDRTCPSVIEPDGAAGTTAGSSGSGGSTGGSAGTSGGSAGSGGSEAGQGGTAAGANDAGPDGDSATCTVGSEGCACTATRGCDTGLLCRSNICMKPVCGDSRTEGNEFCDDGQNLGAAVGDCAPDCSAIVVQKKIVLSAAEVPPNFDRGASGEIIANADRNCASGYKALFAHPPHRIATITPNVGDGQKDWVLRPWTRYVTEAGAPIWLTNQSALLGVVDRKYQGLTNALAGGYFAITGMQADWTVLPSGHNCTNWTSLTADLEIGWSWRPDANFLQGTDLILYPCSGGSTYRVMCVEQ